MKKFTFIFVLVILALGLVRLHANTSMVGTWDFYYDTNNDGYSDLTGRYQFNSDGTVTLISGYYYIYQGRWTLVDNNKLIMNSNSGCNPTFSATKIGGALVGFHWGWGAGEWSTRNFYAIKLSD